MTLHRARVWVGLALFGATVAGALFGHTAQADACQLAGATLAVAGAKWAHLI